MKTINLPVRRHHPSMIPNQAGFELLVWLANGKCEKAIVFLDADNLHKLKLPSGERLPINEVQSWIKF